MEKSEEILAMLAKQLNKKAADLTPDKRIKEDLNADSLDVVEILMSIEDKYGITVPDEVVMQTKKIIHGGILIFVIFRQPWNLVRREINFIYFHK